MITVEDSKNNKVGEIPMTNDVYDILRTVDKKGEYVICKLNGEPYRDIRSQWVRLEENPVSMT